MLTSLSPNNHRIRYNIIINIIVVVFMVTLLIGFTTLLHGNSLILTSLTRRASSFSPLIVSAFQPIERTKHYCTSLLSTTTASSLISISLQQTLFSSMSDENPHQVADHAEDSKRNHNDNTSTKNNSTATATSATTATATVAHNTTNTTSTNNNIPLYRSEGLFAVYKPKEWTSQDAVSYIRGILERDAKNRGCTKIVKVTTYRGRRKKNKNQIVRVGHGGTLDPLATGVLVIGVGKGTKQLQQYLSGSKAYRATGLLGKETTTLDLDPKGNITKEASWDHVTVDNLKATLPAFIGKIQQIPPIYSAKKVNGKKLYEAAREGQNISQIEPKEVDIYQLQLVTTTTNLPYFTIDMECGGGTFVRSLIRDIAYSLDTVATTAELERTKQGPFMLKDCLSKDDWSADQIYACIDEWNEKLSEGM